MLHFSPKVEKSVILSQADKNLKDYSFQ